MNKQMMDEKKVKQLTDNDRNAIIHCLLPYEKMMKKRKEAYCLVGLTNDFRVLFIEQISFRILGWVFARPMQVFANSLIRGAASVVLVNYRVAGKLMPTEKEKLVTGKLMSIGLLVHIPVMDHLIFQGESYISLKEKGILDSLTANSRCRPSFAERMRADAEAMLLTVENKKQGFLKVARQLKIHGVSSAMIGKITGLAIKEIEEIKITNG